MQSDQHESLSPKPELKHGDPRHMAASASLALPVRPPHPNPRLTAAVLAPLLCARGKFTLQALEALMTTPKSTMGIVINGQVIPGSGNSMQTANLRLSETASQIFSRIQELERATNELSQSITSGSADAQVAVWKSLIAPLLDQTIDRSKGQRQSSGTAEKVLGELIEGFQTSNTSEQEDEDSPDTSLPSALKRFSSMFSKLSQRENRRERSQLSTLRYDPHLQREECRLNEVALDLKLHRVESTMHPREPVVQIGEDDLKLAALFYADCIKEWLTEARVQLFNDFIDPTNAVFVQDEEALQAQCSAIGGACEVRCEICGCDEVVFATEIPATSFLDKQSVQNRFDELLAPSKAFTEALGISYAIDISRQNDSNVIKLRMFLPPVSSRYEPENFSSRERDLARQGSISLEDFKKLIHGDDSEVTAGEEIEPPSPEEDVAPELQITENVELEVDPGVAKALKQEELVKVLSLLKELAGRQPTSLAAEVRLSNHFESLFVGPEAPVFVIHQAITYLGSTLDRYREFVELSRTRAPASDPMEEIKLMLDSTRSTCTSFQGAIDVSKIDLMLQQAPRLPDFVSCVGVRARLFGLSEEMYSEFLRLIHQHKEECGAENLILWEVPLDPLKHKSGEHSCYMLFSGDGIPLTKLVVDCKKSQVSSEPMPATTLRELRDTILVALSRIDTQSPQSRIRRREIDQVMLAMSLDLSDFMINELLVVANSWRGRPIPPSRISKLLNQYILDSKFTLSKDGATIRYLHESELQS